MKISLPPEEQKYELYLTSSQKPCKQGKEQGEIFKVFIKRKKKTYQPRMLYPEKTSFKSEENKDFLKQNLRASVGCIPAFQEILKKFFREKENNSNTGQKLRST